MSARNDQSMASNASKSGKSTKQPRKPANKTPARSGGKAKSRAGSGDGRTRSNPFLRAEVLGTALVVLAVFTLLSLVSGSRGDVTAGWLGLLRSLFGEAVWGIPLVTGILGLWLIIRAIERMPNMSWQRPAGFAVLFLALVTAFALRLPASGRMEAALSGEGGGQFGTAIADLLQAALGTWGAWAAVTFLTVTGLAILADRFLLDAWLSLQQWSHARGEDTAAAAPLRSPISMPSGVLPWWKRLLAPPADQARPGSQPPVLAPGMEPVLPPAAGNLVRPDDARSPGLAPSRPVAMPNPLVPASPPQRTVTQPSTEGDLLNPRIVGSLQDWKLPVLSSVLNDWERVSDSDDLIRQQGRLIQETLALFGVPADFEGAYKGPSVTQYLIKPGYVDRKVGSENQRIKVKVAKIAALSNDLALALAAPSVRIEAPIPGTSYVGVEVPNQAANVVGLKELMESETFVDMKGRLRIALGEDVKGTPVVSDLARMPHLLIAGATGSGKSVCINSVIACLLLTHTPETLRLLMVDPKMVELSVYNGIPHLLSPVVIEVDKAAQVLFWAVKEMERRYALFNKANARDLTRYNVHLQKNGEKPLPTIVVVVDEMADLMMAAPEEVEKHICRLAQMARAVGIHLIIATQRPSVDVITGLIKANFPARIAFAVTSQIDSRVILDVPGAERLLGRGDMLFMAPDASKLERIQGTYLSDEEINKLVRYWKGIRTYENSQLRVDVAGDGSAEESGGSQGFSLRGDGLEVGPGGNMAPSSSSAAGLPGGPLSQPPLFEQIEQMKAADARDEFYAEAVRIVQEHGRVSISLLQRKLRVGYNRAARLVDQLEENGVVGPDLGSGQSRDVRSEALPGGGQSGQTPTTTAGGRAAPVPGSPRPRIIGGSDDGSLE